MNKRGLTLTEIMITVAIIGLVAAIAIPNFARARQKALADVCAQNLKVIEGAKSMWALDTGAGKNEEPSEEELGEYIQSGFPQPVIAGALYTIGTLVVPASCSYHGDSLGNRPAHYKESGYTFSPEDGGWVSTVRDRPPAQPI